MCVKALRRSGGEGEQVADQERMGFTLLFSLPSIGLLFVSLSFRCLISFDHSFSKGIADVIPRVYSAFSFRNTGCNEKGRTLAD